MMELQVLEFLSTYVWICIRAESFLFLQEMLISFIKTIYMQLVNQGFEGKYSLVPEHN
jgi:hypothetical protein